MLLASFTSLLTAAAQHDDPGRDLRVVQRLGVVEAGPEDLTGAAVELRRAQHDDGVAGWPVVLAGDPPDARSRADRHREY